MAHRNIIVAALVAGAIFVLTKPASGQSFLTDGNDVRVNLSATLVTSAAADAPILPAPAVASAAAPGEYRQVQTPSALRGGLVALYASTVTLQMLDVRSTYAVIERGGAEGNPLMASVVQSKPAFIALKVGIAASTILAAHQVAKHNKVAAIITLVGLNCVYASVVAHNFNLARDMR